MVFRSCLLVIGITLWWLLLDTANRFADQRSIVMIDRQTFAFLVEHKPPLGQPKSRIEIRDHHFNLLRRGPFLGSKPNSEVVGSGPLYPMWIPDPTKKAHELHLLDTRDFSSRVVRSETPFAATSCRITRDGKWLILVADSKVNYFKMYSLPELKEVDAIELGGNFVRPIDTEFAIIENSQVILFNSGKFEVRDLPQEVGNLRLMHFSEGAVLFWSSKPTTIQGKPPTNVFVYWPKDNRIEPVNLPIGNSTRISHWRLVNAGQWTLSNEFEGNSRFRAVRELDGDLVCRIPLANHRTDHAQRLLFQELDTFKWQPITNQLEIWDADTCSKHITFDLRRFYIPMFLTLVFLSVVWSGLWWFASCRSTITFSGILGTNVGICTVCTAISIFVKMDHNVMDRSIATQLHLMVGYMVIPVASWWIAFANENWLARIAQATILLGLCWLGSPNDQPFENFYRVLFVIVPILLGGLMMSFLHYSTTSASKVRSPKKRVGIRDLMLLGVAVGFAMHMLGFTEGNRLRGPNVLAFLKFYPIQDLMKVIRIILVISVSQAGLVLMCYGALRLRIFGVVMFATTFGWYYFSYQPNGFQFFGMLSYGLFVMLALIPVPLILKWLIQGLHRFYRLAFKAAPDPIKVSNQT